MSDSSSVRVDEEELSIDPQLLFQRLISVAKGSVRVEDLDTFFSYESCTYPPSIFKSAHPPRHAKKSVFAAGIQKSSQSTYGQGLNYWQCTNRMQICS